MVRVGAGRGAAGPAALMLGWWTRRWALPDRSCPGTAGWGRRGGLMQDICSHPRSPALQEGTGGHSSLQEYPRSALMSPFQPCPPPKLVVQLSSRSFSLLSLGRASCALSFSWACFASAARAHPWVLAPLCASDKLIWGWGARPGAGMGCIRCSGCLEGPSVLGCKDSRPGALPEAVRPAGWHAAGPVLLNPPPCPGVRRSWWLAR